MVTHRLAAKVAAQLWPKLEFRPEDAETLVFSNCTVADRVRQTKSTKISKFFKSPESSRNRRSFTKAFRIPSHVLGPLRRVDRSAANRSCHSPLGGRNKRRSQHFELPPPSRRSPTSVFGRAAVLEHERRSRWSLVLNARLQLLSLSDKRLSMRVSNVRYWRWVCDTPCRTSPPLVLS
jgi:hypothetical protein